MLVENDFAIEGDDERTGPDRPAEPAAVVVVRSRRLRPVAILLPPALVVAASVAVLQYRARTPDWRGLFPDREWSSPADSQAAVASRPRPAPIAIPSDPESALPEPAADPDPPAPPRPVTTTIAILAPQPPPPPDAADPGPGPGPRAVEPSPTPGPVDVEDAWDEIRRESERKRAEVAEMKRLKREAPKQARREQARHRVEQFARVKALADSERPRFRAELRRVIETLGDRSAPRIRSLSDRYSHFVLPETEQRLAATLEGISILDHAARVNTYRRHGVPEPIILNVLAKDEESNIVSRHGPLDEDDALVRAARRLLAVPAGRAEIQPDSKKAQARVNR